MQRYRAPSQHGVRVHARRFSRETKRTRGSRACSRWRFAIKVEVNERVEFLERVRLRRLVVDKHTLPFLRGLLLALEHNHFVVLENAHIRVHVSERGERDEECGRQ